MKPNYTLKTTIRQTLKANTCLEKIDSSRADKYNKDYLFDFSILYNADIEESKKQEIKAQIIKYSDIAWRDHALFSQSDIYTSFHWYSGECYVKAYPCYTEDGKRKYVIMRLVKLDIVFQERKSLYNDFETVSEVHECCDTDYAIEELNIA